MKQQNQINQSIFRKNYNDKDSGIVFLFCLIVPLVLFIITSMIISVIAGLKEVKAENITSSLGYVIAYSICSFAVYLAIYFIYNKTQKIEYSAIKPKFKMKWHTYLLLIMIGVVSLFGIQYFIGVVDNFLKLVGYPLEAGLPTINPTSWGTYILAVFLLAVIPAIEEELFFRGIILNGLRSRFNDIASVLLSAFMFALMHGNLQQLVYPFILGTIMGWIALRTGSLVSSVIVHFINNFLVVTMAFVKNITGFSFMLPDVWWFYLIAVGLLALTGGIYFIVDKFYFKHKSYEEVEKTSTKTSQFIYISLGVGAFMFLFLTVASIIG